MNKINITERSQSYYKQDTADMDTWFKIANRDYDELINGFDFNALFGNYTSPLRLLDIGCGTGKFPSMLHPHLSVKPLIKYDYLDPSQYCLDEIRSVLKLPYIPELPLLQSMERWELDNTAIEQYDLVWSIHAVCNWDITQLASSIKKLQQLLKPETGVAMIFIFSNDSFYNKIYNIYRKSFKENRLKPFVCSEDLMQSLNDLNIDFTQKRLKYNHDILLSQSDVLEKYLQKCVFDSLTLNDWFKMDSTRNLIEENKREKHYCFPQISDLIMFGR